MKKSARRKPKKRIKYDRLGMLGISLIVVLFLAVFMVKSRDLQNTLSAYDAKAAALEESIEEEKNRTEEIDRLKEYMETDEYAEQVARDRLGLVKDNEIVFREE